MCGKFLEFCVSVSGAKSEFLSRVKMRQRRNERNTIESSVLAIDLLFQSWSDHLGRSSKK